MDEVSDKDNKEEGEEEEGEEEGEEESAGSGEEPTRGGEEFEGG